MIVDRPSRGVILVSPDFVEEFVAADHPVGVLYEKLESFEFLGSEHHDSALAFYFHLPEISGDVIEADDLGFSRTSGVAQCGTDSRQEFPWAEGLCDIVICAQFQKENFIGDVAGGAEHHDWQARGDRLDFFADVSAGYLGKPKVEHNGGRCGSSKAVQRRFAVRLGFDGVAFGFKEAS